MVNVEPWDVTRWKIDSWGVCSGEDLERELKLYFKEHPEEEEASG